MDHIIDPDASQADIDAAPRDPFPLGVKLVVAFLCLDALERAVELGAWIRAAASVIGTPRTSTAPNFPVLGLWVAVDILLVMLLLMRTKAGRLFTAAIFVLHAFYVAHVLVVSNPALWLYMSDWGRARLAVSLFLDAVAVTYLFSSQASEALDLA
jgi:hypothetical protein